MTLKLRLSVLAIALILGQTFYAQNSWKQTTVKHADGISKYHLQNDKVHMFQLDDAQFKQTIGNAALRGQSNRQSETVISVPGSNGKMEGFYIYEAPVFSPSLAAKYPQIKSYIGYSTNNSGAVLRMSVSHKGVQTMINYVDKPTVFMMPVSHGSNNYVVYDKSSRGDYEDSFECNTIDKLNKTYNSDDLSFTSRDANDQTLRTFRLAVSVNGEYTAYHGGTVGDALAAINATMTRVNAVFETDMAVTFTLVDAPELIYTDASTDPYSASLGNWNLELQNTLTNTIGNAAYDIGHMFGASGGGGNAGCIGCVCVDDTAATNDLNKGAGITSPADGIPEGDNFDIDYVAHEIGHQMGANHTFSHNTEGTGVNAEPGSGSTIMGYAGITGANNVQQHSDEYFHYHSINQVMNNLVNRTCWVGSAITNNPPSANAGSDHTIPQGTAYVLRGTAADHDGGDTLTYCWEQTDSGQVTNSTFGPTLTSGSMNRSLSPSNSPDRYIPKLSRVIAGQLTQTNPTINSDWETVATVARTMNWALTVRDRSPTATGLNGQSSFDLMQITVDATSGPFVVTSQTTNETWDVGSVQTVTWDVAGTDGGAVNTPTVNIKLSTDGGNTYPHTLATNVANDGSHSVVVPVVGGDSSTARVMVEGNNNIFYAINSTNFSIQESEFALTMPDSEEDVCEPADAVYTFTYNTYLGFAGTTTFSATGLPAGASASFSPTTATADDTPVTVTISGTTAVGVGNYSFNVVGTSGAITKQTEVSLNIYSGTFGTLTLSSPVDDATDVDAESTLTWSNDANAQEYDVEIASDAAFATIVESATVSTNQYTTSMLTSDTEYFWRVKPKNLCGEGAFSATFSFTTKNILCNSYSYTGPAINIPDNNATGITSVINVPGSDVVNITDITVTVNATHPWIGDLTLTLISPNNTQIVLVSSRNDNGQNYTNTTFDDDATNTITSGGAPYTGTFKPEENLSGLLGEYASGDWTLKVADGGAQDIGTLDSWSMNICGSPITTLPTNNFTVAINSETCRANNNGSIDITANIPFNYTAELTGNGVMLSNGFTATTSFTDLSAGTYTLCITLIELPSYSICYDIVVTEPEDLAVLSRVDTSADRVTLELSGGDIYFIDLNGVITQTTESEITLELASGVNQLKVTTDKDCQGTYRETINNITKTLISPNPIEDNYLNVYVNQSVETITITMYSILGKQLLTKRVSTLDGKSTVNISELSTGIYIVNVNTGSSQTNHKIIKK